MINIYINAQAAHTIRVHRLLTRCYYIFRTLYAAIRNMGGGKIKHLIYSELH